MAQAECAWTLEQTNERRQAAIEKGIQFGRKLHRGSARALKMIRKEATAKEVREATGISRASYFRLERAS